MEFVYNPKTDKYTKKEQNYYTEDQVRYMMQQQQINQLQALQAQQQQEAAAAGSLGMGMLLGWFFFGRH